MQFSPLSHVKQRVLVGAPLPFNVRDSDQTLLLARGHIVQTVAQMEALFERGALVDLAELQTPAERVQLATPAELPGLWTDCLNNLGDTLRRSDDPAFLGTLESNTAPVLSLVERDKDLAIFQVLRQAGGELAQYGVTHATLAAITGYMVAQRLGWSADDAQRVFKAGLTMNLSMFELQGQLAIQLTPPTPEQRAAIHAHPEYSRTLLELAGVTDYDWLKAVSQHHEHHDGSGYPTGTSTPSDLAMLLRRADVYTAKLSPRAGREAIAADKAGRMMFMQEPGHPMVSALVKEFGVYPPGCFVRLMSGETGLVVKRGATVMSPVVAVLTSPTGAAMPQPLRRDTAQKAYAVHSVLGVHTRQLTVTPDKLMAVLLD